MEAIENSIAEVAPVAGEEQQTGAENQQEQVVEQTELNEDGTPREPVAKPAKTEAEREREKMQRAIDKKTRQMHEARGRADELERRLAEIERGQLRKPKDGVESAEGDDEPVQLTRKELAEMVKARAATQARTMGQQASELEHRQGVVASLEKAFGKEKFDQMSGDLDEALDGIRDAHGRTKPAMDAIFHSENPAGVVEYLANPDNADEAEAISRMSAIKAAMAVARIDAKLPAKGKPPQRSNRPAPIEPVHARGTASESAPDPTKDAKAYRRWANERDAKARA